MHIYSAIVLANLMVTGLASHSQNVGFRFTKLYQSDSVQQQLLELLAQNSNLENECPNDGQSPPPGCGRR